MDSGTIGKLARTLGVNQDDLLIEVRAPGGRTTVVLNSVGDMKRRMDLGHLQNVDEMGSFIEGIRAGRRIAELHATTRTD